MLKSLRQISHNSARIRLIKRISISVWKNITSMLNIFNIIAFPLSVRNYFSEYNYCLMFMFDMLILWVSSKNFFPNYINAGAQTFIKWTHLFKKNLIHFFIIYLIILFYILLIFKVKIFFSKTELFKIWKLIRQKHIHKIYSEYHIII